jgi:hypothetical protein
VPARYVEHGHSAAGELDVEREAADRCDARPARNGELHRFPRRQLERLHVVETELRTRCVHRSPRRRTFFADDPRGGFEVPRTESPSSQRRRPDQHDLVLDECLGLKLRGCRNAGDDGEFDVVRPDELERTRRRRQPEVDLDPRIHRREPPERSRQEVGARDPGRRERERSDLRVGAFAECAPCVREQRFGAEDVVGEDLAGRRERHLTPPAHE